MAAGLLGVGPSGWCFLVLAAGLVLDLSELTHSRRHFKARLLGDPEAPARTPGRSRRRRPVVVVVFASVSITVLVLKLNEMLGWWH